MYWTVGLLRTTIAPVTPTHLRTGAEYEGGHDEISEIFGQIPKTS